MNKMNEYIKILISKYVSGTLSDEEAVRLAKWIKMSGDNAELFRNEVRAMEKTGQRPPMRSNSGIASRKTNSLARIAPENLSGERGQNMPVHLPLQ